MIRTCPAVSLISDLFAGEEMFKKVQMVCREFEDNYDSHETFLLVLKRVSLLLSLSLLFSLSLLLSLISDGLVP